MMPLPPYPMEHYLKATESVVEAKLGQKNRLMSEGSIHLFTGDRIQKMATLSLKGLNVYHYDFGIVYPEKEYNYPLFLYQIILVRKRALAVVHYPYYAIGQPQAIKEMEAVLQQEAQYQDLFLRASEPQAFLENQVLPSTFNGLVRISKLEETYQAIAHLFQGWHRGLCQQEKGIDTEEMGAYDAWTRDFSKRFYENDYGYQATKRYLGQTWAKFAFEQCIFTDLNQKG